MLNIEDIVSVAWQEAQGLEEEENSAQQISYPALLANARSALSEPNTISNFHNRSPVLSVVRFRCLLQDTGYAPEVYLPGDGSSAAGDAQWSHLKERWVGWGVSIPGEQRWVSQVGEGFDGSLERLGIDDAQPALPAAVHKKFPLREQSSEGALIKIYGEASYRPSSSYSVVGLVSRAPLPSPYSSEDVESIDIVPTIHVLVEPEPAYPRLCPDPTLTADASTRERLVQYLSTAFEPPDVLAGEVLLLSLISAPTSRPTALPPLGVLSVNIQPSGQSITAKLKSVISAVWPTVVSIPLSMPFLHSANFAPASSDSATLDAGVLQLADDTVILIEGDAMGQGGQLAEKAVKNLEHLSNCISKQTLRYEYPYMDSLQIACSLKALIVSEAKSFLPVDVQLPLETAPQIHSDGGTCDLAELRSFLLKLSSREHAAKLDIPDETSEKIQEDFVAGRQLRVPGAADSELNLKRRMKLARLLALSYPEAILSLSIWSDTLKLDSALDERIQAAALRRKERAAAIALR